MKEVLSSIQIAKKSLGVPQLAQSAQRSESLRRLAETLKSNHQRLYVQFGAFEGLSAEDFEVYVMKPLERYSQDVVVQLHSESDRIDRLWRPSGLLSFLLPEQLFLRVLLEKLFEVIASGNSALFKLPRSLSDKVSVLNEIFAQVLDSSYGSGRVLFLPSNEFSRQLLVSHPSINGVWLAGRLETQAAVLQSSLPSLHQKKWSFHGPASNTALVLAGADLQGAARSLLRSSFLGAGRWPWSIKKIITLDSDFKEFCEIFTAETKAFLSETTSLKNGEASFESSLDKLNGMKKEEGFLLLDGARLDAGKLGPSLFRDLPHCSESQQEELRFPVSLLSSVKYAHEMIRWTNLGGMVNGVQIFGPEDKALSLVKKIESRRIWLNSWIESDVKLLPGLKHSQWGASDLTWQSDFFGESRSLTSKL